MAHISGQKRALAAHQNDDVFAEHTHEKMVVVKILAGKAFWHDDLSAARFAD